MYEKCTDVVLLTNHIAFFDVLVAVAVAVVVALKFPNNVYFLTEGSFAWPICSPPPPVILVLPRA